MKRAYRELFKFYRLPGLILLALGLFVWLLTSNYDEESVKPWIEWLHIFLPVLVIVIEVSSIIILSREEVKRDGAVIRIEDANTSTVKELAGAIKAMERFSAAMGRPYYMESIVAAIARSQHEVVFTTATMSASWQEEGQKKILDTVIERFAKSANCTPPTKYRHRGLVAKKPSTLPGTIELIALTDVEVRMCPVMAMSRLRFVVQDTAYSVIGIATKKDHSPPDGQSSMSFSVDSTMLALALHDRFEQLWGKSDMTAWQYLSEHITNAFGTKEDLCRPDIRSWLGLNNASSSHAQIIREKLEKHCPEYAKLPEDRPALNSSGPAAT